MLSVTYRDEIGYVTVIVHSLTQVDGKIYLTGDDFDEVFPAENLFAVSAV